MKLKLIKKILSTALITVITLNPVVIPWTIYAEDETPTPTVTETQTEAPTPTPDTSSQSQNEPTPTPVETSTQTEIPQDTVTPIPSSTPSSTTTTGDADAQAASDTTANSTTTTIDGQIDTSGCSVSGSVSCPVDINNGATNESSTSASATSGVNDTSNTLGDGTINTGTSSATAATKTDLNKNEVTAASSGDASGDSSSGESSVSTDNTADSKTTTTADSTSGGNNNSGNGGNSTTTTGDSYASAAAANFINTNLVGSNYRFLIYNIYATENTTINLNEIWKEIEGAIGGNTTVVPSEANTLAISIKNDAKVDSAVSATATSGENKGNNNGGNVTIVTGNSFASANLFNLINTNIIGADFLFVIINIFGTLNGDIVVPSTERFNESMAAYNQGDTKLSAGSVVIDNYARVEGCQALADANSGKNTSSGRGDQTTTTGGAYASATTINIINTTLSWENWMSFIINNFGSWTGSVKGWEDPTASTQAAANTTTTLDNTSSNEQEGTLATANEDSETNLSTTSIENTASVSSNISAQANSGGNEALDNRGDISITTGMAIALANAISFINTNIFGGKFLFVFINLFGRWDGNFVFAYPDLQIGITESSQTVTPGQDIDYTISYVNKGYEDARSAKAEVSLPKDIIYIGNSLNSTPEIQGTTYIFSLGDVAWGKGGSFIIRAKINSSISPNETTDNSILEIIKDKIITKAYAQGKEKDLVVNVTITTGDPESDPNNNSASATTKVTLPDPSSDNNSSSSQTNTGTPKLEVTSSHNVGKYVYPGDIVTFFVLIKNSGDATAKNVKVNQNIHNGTPDPVGIVSQDVGDIESQKTVKLTYGLIVPKTVIPGLYHSIIFAEGNSEVGNKVTSEYSQTDFMVESRFQGLVETVQAQEESPIGESRSILGESTPLSSKNEKNYLPYILSVILATLWFIERIRRKRIEKELITSIKNDRIEG